MIRALVELHSDTIGDLAVDVALLNTLVRAYPDIYLEVCLRIETASLIEDCAFIRRRHLVRKGNLVSFFNANRHSLSFDWNLIVLSENSNYGAIRAVMRAKNILGPDDRDEKFRERGILWHRLSVLHKLLPSWQQDVDTTIPLLEGRREHALRVVGAGTGEKIMTLAPGATEGEQVWPHHMVVEVIEQVRDMFDKILVVGHAGNARHCMRIAESVGIKAVAGSLPLPYTCSLLTQAKLHLGSDESLALVAALQRTPTLLVGGNLDGYRKAGRQESLHGNLQSIEVARVADKVRDMLGG